MLRPTRRQSVAVDRTSIAPEGDQHSSSVEASLLHVKEPEAIEFPRSSMFEAPVTLGHWFHNNGEEVTPAY